MLYSEFHAQLAKVGLSVRGFAELIGMNPNSISNYARAGELPTHLAIIVVLIVGIAEVGGNYRDAIGKLHIAPKRPRGRAREGHFGGDPQTDLDLRP